MPQLEFGTLPLGGAKPEILDSEGGGNSPGENQAPAPPIGTTLVHLSLCV